MKFFHLSDLHIGKRVNEFSMLEDQKHILAEILNAVDDEKPDAVVIAGDVYDKTVPPSQGVTLFDEFLTSLAKRGPEVLIVSGNHDSPERLAYGAKLFKKGGIHISPVFDGAFEPVVLHDGFGEVRFWLLPFIKPLHARAAYDDDTIQTSTDALRAAITHMRIDANVRNVLIAHQFVTGAALSADSEEMYVGGADNADASVFDDFDYVALGHIHKPQHIGRETVRYCGTPQKYAFSEIGNKNGICVVEFGKKGETAIRAIPLRPLHEMREIRGSYNELTLRENYEGTATDDYLRIVLTDEDDVPGAFGRLNGIYPNLMQLAYDNARTRTNTPVEFARDAQRKTETELFGELFEKQNGRPMSEEQTALVASIFERLKEERQ